MGWMMGARKVCKNEGMKFDRGKEIVVSRATSPGSSGGSGRSRFSAADLGMDESEYISVYGDRGPEVGKECDHRCEH